MAHVDFSKNAATNFKVTLHHRFRDLFKIREGVSITSHAWTGLSSWDFTLTRRGVSVYPSLLGLELLR